MQRIAGNNGKLMGHERRRAGISLQISQAIKTAEKLIAVRVRVEVCSPIRDDTKAHVELVHVCEIDVLPGLAHCIGQGFQVMLLNHYPLHCSYSDLET